MKKLSTSDFINRSKKIHKSKYNYSLVEYKGAFSYVKIICEIHGEFEQMPSHHLQGRGCKRCAFENRRNNINNILKKANKIHKNKYDYSKIKKYLRNSQKHEIKCKLHGTFLMSFHNHIDQKQGCPKCGQLKAIKSRTDTMQEVVKKFIQIHGNKYIYSKINYKNTNSKVEIICKKHGSFFQRPNDHIQGHGCIKCMYEENSTKFKLKKNELKKILSIRNKDKKFDYSLIDLENFRTGDKVKIICKVHGEFSQSFSDHIYKKSDCPKCSRDYLSKLYAFTTKEFIEKAKIIHGERYSYKNVNYKNNRTKVTIFCKIHGSFRTTPDTFLRGVGCPECATYGTDNNVIYIWEAHGHKINEKRIFKIGITSERLSNTRILHVEKVSGFKADLIRIKSLKNAAELETKILKIGEKCNFNFKGGTEFRIFTDKELKKVLQIFDSS